LAIRNRPPTRRIRSRPEISWPRIVKSGAVSLTIHASESSSSTRMIIAIARPMVRAFFCCSIGSLPDRMEMKMTLSMPRTISRTVNVNRAIHACGSESHAIEHSSSRSAVAAAAQIVNRCIITAVQ
jgi:hypothetical protein